MSRRQDRRAGRSVSERPHRRASLNLATLSGRRGQRAQPAQCVLRHTRHEPQALCRGHSAHRSATCPDRCQRRARRSHRHCHRPWVLRARALREHLQIGVWRVPLGHAARPRRPWTAPRRSRHATLRGAPAAACSTSVDRRANDDRAAQVAIRRQGQVPPPTSCTRSRMLASPSPRLKHSQRPRRIPGLSRQSSPGACRCPVSVTSASRAPLCLSTLFSAFLDDAEQAEREFVRPTRRGTFSARHCTWRPLARSSRQCP